MRASAGEDAASASKGVDAEAIELGSSCAYLAFEIVNDWANIVHILAMCDALVDLGIDTELFAYPEGPVAPSADEVRQRWGLDHELSIAWLPLNPNRWLARARLSLESFRAGRRHDFIYTRNPLAALGALLGGTPAVILEMHQPEDAKHGRLAFSLARLSRRLHIVCISRRLAEIIAEDFRLDESKIIVEHTGTKLPVRCDYEIDTADGRRLIATYVGTFAPGRGLETIFAMAERFPDIDFVVVGGEAPEVSIPSNVDVRNAIAHGLVPALLSSSDVLLMPYTRNVMLPDGNSGTGEYCSPLKMFEYLATGRSIISSDLPSISEVLVDGSNALVVDELSVDQWCDALGRLASDPALRVRLARGAAATAEHHTLDKRLRRILSEVWSRR